MTLLAQWQEGHQACNNCVLVCWCFDCSCLIGAIYLTILTTDTSIISCWGSWNSFYQYKWWRLHRGYQAETKESHGTAVTHKSDTIWKSQQMSTNKRLLNALSLPTSTYGSKSWTYTKSVINKIHAFQMTTDPQLLTVTDTKEVEEIQKCCRTRS